MKRFILSLLTFSFIFTTIPVMSNPNRWPLPLTYSLMIAHENRKNHQEIASIDESQSLETKSSSESSEESKTKSIIDLLFELWFASNPDATEEQKDSAIGTITKVVLESSINGFWFGQGRSEIGKQIVQSYGMETFSKGFFLNIKPLKSLLSNACAFINPCLFWDLATGNYSNLASYIDVKKGLKILTLRHVVYPGAMNAMKPVSKKVLNDKQQQILSKWLVNKFIGSEYIRSCF